MKWEDSESPGHSVICHEETRHMDGDALHFRLHEDIRLRYPALEKFCCSNLEPVDLDLLFLVALVAAADRHIVRGRHWTRRIRLHLPVHEPDLWSAPEITDCLSETLRFSTGDLWTFSFSARKTSDGRALNLFHESSQGDGIVMPYSGGLDSFAELKLLPFRYPNKRPILVSTEINKGISSLVGSTADSRRASRLCIPVDLPSRKHPEPSYRTRTFLFFVLAAVAAKLAKSEYVLIPENGQGAIGPSLVPSGDQHPFQSSHPGFTYRLSRFLKGIWGPATPAFRHPNLWLTKAQLISEVIAYGGIQGCQSTRSCGSTPKRAKGSSSPWHCGFCSGCLLRRLAIFSAGADHDFDGERYLAQDFNAQTLQESVDVGLRGKLRPITQNDELIAAAAVIDHKYLAAISNNDFAVRTAPCELARGSGIQEPEAKKLLMRLLLQHRSEWKSFVDSLSPHSWISRLAEMN